MKRIIACKKNRGKIKMNERRKCTGEKQLIMDNNMAIDKRQT